MKKPLPSYTKGVASGFLCSLLCVANAAAANDPDSFGRSVRYLDVAVSQPTLFQFGPVTCGEGTTCKSIADLGTEQTFESPDRARIGLPAGSTNSLLCFSLTHSLSYSILNFTTVPATSLVSDEIVVTIDSPVLANPLLINKTTGQPFGGSIAILVTGYFTDKTLLPGGAERQQFSFSRECQLGLITLQDLQTTYGLSLSQARSVLRSPMTLRFSTFTRLMNTRSLRSRFGVRIFGD
jgi:hypothetical protein